MDECYEAMGGDYSEVLERLCSKELIKRVMIMYLTDDSFDKLCSSLSEKRYDDAYADAIAVKGVSGNMGFSGLYKAASDIVEALKIRNFAFARCTDEDFENLLCMAKENYNKTIAAIKVFNEENTAKKEKKGAKYKK